MHRIVFRLQVLELEELVRVERVDEVLVRAGGIAHVEPVARGSGDVEADVEGFQAGPEGGRGGEVVVVVGPEKARGKDDVTLK